MKPKPTKTTALLKLTRSVDGLRRQFERSKETDRIRTGRARPLPLDPQFWSGETRTVARKLHEHEQLRERIKHPQPPAPAVPIHNVSRERP